jgi:hypothetical protein
VPSAPWGPDHSNRRPRAPSTFDLRSQAAWAKVVKPMVEHKVSVPEAGILKESALSSDGCANLRRPYNGTWVGDIKMFRDLEHRNLMQFVDYQEILPVKDRVRRSKITDAGRTALTEFDSTKGVVDAMP